MKAFFLNRVSYRTLLTIRFKAEKLHRTDYLANIRKLIVKLRDGIRLPQLAKNDKIELWNFDKKSSIESIHIAVTKWILNKIHTT